LEELAIKLKSDRETRDLYYIVGEDFVKEGMVGDVVDPFFHPLVILRVCIV
jgi:hypothetical protein